MPSLIVTYITGILIRNFKLTSLATILLAYHSATVGIESSSGRTSVSVTVTIGSGTIMRRIS